jgi:hypothetical protein
MPVQRVWEGRRHPRPGPPTIEHGSWQNATNPRTFPFPIYHFPFPATVASVCFYISGHGFGHASRQIEIINALGPRLPPDWKIVVRTAAAQWLFDRTVRVPIEFVPGPIDTGVIQIDSLRLDEHETARAAGRFYADFAEHVGRERAFLGQHDVRLVIGDAPPLACSAAAAAGIPSVVCANFTWDWIYEGYADAFASEAPHALPLIREAYADATAAWRLPLHGGFATIGEVQDVPFVARHATRARNDVLAALNLPGDTPLVLTSFGGYGFDGFDWTGLDCLRDWTVVVTGRGAPQQMPRGVAAVDEALLYGRGLRYEDLVAAVDVVITKPGYGIVSECIANGTAMLYTSRGHFVEYDVMVLEMPKVLRCAFIPQDELLAGRWRARLDRLHDAPPAPERPPTDGSVVVAGAILRML